MPSSSATAWARTGWARPETRTRCFSPWLVMPVIFGGLLRGSGRVGGFCRGGGGGRGSWGGCVGGWGGGGGCRTVAGSGVGVGTIRFAALLGAGGIVGGLGSLGGRLGLSRSRGLGLRGFCGLRGLGGRGSGAAGDGPALEDALRPAADRERPGGHVAADHGAGAGIGTVAHFHRGDEHVVRPG